MNPKTLIVSGLVVLTAVVVNGAPYFPLGAAGATLLGLGTNSAALTLGATPFFITPPGIVAIGLGLIGAGIVKANFWANVGTRFIQRERRRRSTPEEEATALDKIDRYFNAVADMDTDDCGKRLVCEIEALPEDQRSDDERLIAGLFGENNVIDPASAKAEYDLAAYLGATTQSKIACARRYHRCPADRKTIIQALEKSKSQQ